MKLTIRSYARKEGITLDAAYRRAWNGTIPGATQDSRGRWQIPAQDTPTSQPVADWKVRACGPDQD